MAADEAAQGELMPKKKKKSTEDAAAERRRKNITPGSLMKAIIRAGEGTTIPVEGDQVIFHHTTRTLDGVTVDSTRLEHGGKGIPIRYILGKSKMILGFCEGIPTMTKGEVAMFKMKPEVHYAEDNCPVTAPETFPIHDELQFEIEMLDFFKVNEVAHLESLSTLAVFRFNFRELTKVISEDLGVVKKIVDEGQGWETPREPYEVTSWITAKAADGSTILSRSLEPYCFTFGKSEVPKGLEMAIGTMTRGEKAIVFVSNNHLTKSSLLRTIERLEEVQFEVELVCFIQVRDMLGDGRLIKRRIVDGRGEFPMDCPLQDSLLRVHYKGMLLNEEKNVFCDTRVDNSGEPLEFSSGEGLVPEGLEMCVRLMLPGEVSLVTCPPDYAYDKFERPNNVPEGAYIQWEIELVGFEMPKDWTGLSFQEIMDESEKIRNTGNRLFKEGKFELAKAKYEKLLREYNHVNPQDDEEGKVFLNSRNSLHLNVAACYHKMGDYRKSIETCNKVLDVNPLHVKALYRRGMAYMLGGDFDEARNDFKKMTTIDKSSEPDATAAVLKLKQKEQEVEKKARRQFKGLFDKKPGEIAEVGTASREEQDCDEQKDKDEAASSESNENRNILDEDEDVPGAYRMGFFANLWPSGRKLLGTLGLNRCSIL